ncbi:MAG: UPF0716 protein FxsA [Glaciecola sp.]|jgi:UPF0716 protein FxsA|mmetsp:Transcript_31246/g.99654  ORF Transcript_31246/g.99654 Transcript_31246/m.99654 type:complete len:202 (+) Transcript_31246:80-685(+)
MFGRLFILFAILPILEIMLLINVSDNIGGWNTFALVLITAFLGAYFVRREGANTLRNVQTKMAQGEMPGKELSEGLLLLIAGVLLVTPGFITDIVGLLFTLPFTRAPIAASLVKSFMKSGKGQASFSFHQQGFHGSTSSSFHQKNEDGSVFDAEYVDKTDASKSGANVTNIDYKDQDQSSADSKTSESENSSVTKDDEKNR